MKKIHALALSAILLGTVPVIGSADSFAQAAAPAAAEKKADGARPNRWIVKNDTNKDGMLGKAEFMAIHEQFFKDVDTNKDGSLSAQEVNGHNQAKRAERAKARADRMANKPKKS